jgi:hypothetical protein
MSKNRDIGINLSNNDLEIVNGDLVIVTGGKLTEQRIRRALGTFEGEWFRDNSVGIPFYDRIFEKGMSLSEIESIFINELNSMPEVAEIIEFEVNKISNNKLLVKFTVIDNSDNLLEGIEVTV